MFFSKMSIFSINLFKKSEIERQILASIQFAQSVMKFKNSKLKKKRKEKGNIFTSFETFMELSTLITIDDSLSSGLDLF